jgi:hypothetical protein
MGAEGRELKKREITDSQRPDSKTKEKPSRFVNGKKPSLIEGDSRPKVLIVESQGNLLPMIEGSLKDKCNILFGYYNFCGVESVLQKIPHDLDILIIGVGFEGNAEHLAREIKSKNPQTKIIKLASTSEHKRITESMQALTKPVFDHILNFSYVDQLPNIIEE